MPEHPQPELGPDPHTPRPPGPGDPQPRGGPGGPGPDHSASTGPAALPASSAPLGPFQGPVVYNRTAAAAGHTMRVMPDDLLAAAASLTRHTEQSSATPGLRVTPAAAGNPQAGQALAALADQFATTLAALDADRGAAVHNLNESARLYESVEIQLRQHMINTLGPVIDGLNRSAPPGSVVPTPRPELPGVGGGLPGSGLPSAGVQGSAQPSGGPRGDGPQGGGPQGGGPLGGGPHGREPRGSGK